MIADDVVKARRRMRNAWIAGFISAGISLIVALSSFSGSGAEAQRSWTTGQFAFVLTEAGLTAALSYGIVKRFRAAAVLLFFCFFIIKVTAYSMGFGKLPALPLQLLFGYLFFQGMRGALTFHHLTHPRRPIPPVT